MLRSRALLQIALVVLGAAAVFAQEQETKTRQTPTRETGRAVTVDLLAVASPATPGRAFGDSGVRMGSGTIRVEPALDNLVMPAGASRVLFFFGPGFSSPYGYHAAEVTLDRPATSVTVTRPGVQKGASTPAWQVQALDAAGAQIGTPVGEGDMARGNYLFPSVPQDYTIAAPGIRRIRFASNNNQSTFAAIPFARVTVTLAPGT
jgi:hypothetical protein